MAKIEKLFSKVVMILFLLMIVIGFTIPGFLQGQNPGDQVPQVEPRICQTDADCYLICNDLPNSVLCFQNLCWQNACEEHVFFPFNENPLTFSLAIEIEGEEVNLAERSNAKDFFVTFEGDKVSIFSSGVALAQVLDKISVSLDTCLTIDRKDYCSDEDATLQMLVNGEESFDSVQYIPKEGDVIQIIHTSN